MAASPTIGDVKALNKLTRQLKSRSVKLQFWPLTGSLKIIRFPDASYRNNEDGSPQRGMTVFFVKSNQITSNQIKSHQITSNQIKTHHIKSHQNKTKHITSHQIRSDQIRSDQIRSDQIRSDQIRSDQIRSDHTTSDHIKSHPITSNHIKSNHVKCWMSHPLIKIRHTVGTCCFFCCSYMCVLRNSLFCFLSGSFRERVSLCVHHL